MAPPLAKAWSNRDHGTSTSNNVMILAQLLITEAGIATAAAYHTKITLELANLNSEMVTLRRMLEAQSSSSPTVHHSIAAVSTVPPPSPSTYVPPTIRCRDCQKELLVSSGTDKYLCEQVKNGTMKPRLTCFDCKKKYKLARDARKNDAAALEAIKTSAATTKTSAAATKPAKKAKKNNIKRSAVAQPPPPSSSAAMPSSSLSTIQPIRGWINSFNSPSFSSVVSKSSQPQPSAVASSPSSSATSLLSSSLASSTHGKTHLALAVAAAKPLNISQHPPFSGVVGGYTAHRSTVTSVCAASAVSTCPVQEYQDS